MSRFAAIIEQSGAILADAEGEADVRSIELDSRKVQPGALFVCMPSTHSDSHAYLPAASEAGATAALCHSREGFAKALELGLSAAWSPAGIEFQEALWRITRTVVANPTRSMQVVGVTGTNGKTTVAWLLHTMLGHLGRSSSYIGTLGFSSPIGFRLLENTTPFAVELNNLIVEAKSSGADALSMEVSSHALKERRADGIEFDAAIFTNLSQDHLDFHRDMADYEAAKLRLFKELPKQTRKPFVAAVNADDPVGARWRAGLGVPTISYGSTKGDLRGHPTSVLVDSLEMRIDYLGATVEAKAGVGGSFNVANCLSAVAGLLALGYELEQAAAALATVKPVPGRFEAIANDRGIGVIVDYAHTPDALEKLLDSVHSLKPKRILTVFGCGGDRDRTKRPKMAKVVSERSDVSVLTSDNPRTEDPAGILAEVAVGLVPGSESVQILDRREAIAHAIRSATEGDVVVIAGKGHENYQIIGRVKHPMDDREMAREALA